MQQMRGVEVGEDGEEGSGIQHMAAASAAYRGVQRRHGARGGPGVSPPLAAAPQRELLLPQHVWQPALVLRMVVHRR